MVLFDVRVSVHSIDSLPWCRLTLVSESCPKNVSIFRLTPPTMLPIRPAMDHVEEGRTCAHSCRKKHADLENALLVTARACKLLDSSLVILLFPKPQSHFLFAIDPGLDCRFMIQVLFGYIAAIIPSLIRLSTSSASLYVRWYRSSPRAVDLRMRKSLMCRSCARLDQPCHDSPPSHNTQDESPTTSLLKT
jgi:hypothetical protein